MDIRDLQKLIDGASVRIPGETMQTEDGEREATGRLAVLHGDDSVDIEIEGDRTIIRRLALDAIELIEPT